MADYSQTDNQDIRETPTDAMSEEETPFSDQPT